jgi:hypothetical protein
MGVHQRHHGSAVPGLRRALRSVTTIQRPFGQGTRKRAHDVLCVSGFLSVACLECSAVWLRRAPGCVRTRTAVRDVTHGTIA